MARDFGDMLLNRRREMGLSIQQVANTIKMRPQIIEYFETGNYDAMPPRGYAQGMISSYARFLGLNPREVVDAYFEGLHRYETSSSSPSAANFTGAMDASPRSANATGRYLMVDTRDAGSRFAQRPPQAGYVPESRSPHEMVPGHRLRANAAATRRMPANPSGRDLAAPGRGVRRAGGRPTGRDAGGLPPRTGTRGRGRDQRRDSRGNRGRGAARRRGFDLAGLITDSRFVIGCLAVIAVLLIVVIFLAVRSCSTAPAQAADTGSTVAATTDASAADTATSATASESSTEATGTQDAATADSEAAAAQPTQYAVTVTYTGDSSAWIEIRIDGVLAAESGTVTKGFTHTYTVTGSIEIKTDSTSDVEVTRDGERVRYDSKSAGIGRVTITVPAAAADTQTAATGDASSTAADDTAASTDAATSAAGTAAMTTQ